MSSLSIPDLLSLLRQHKKTGLLSLVSRQDERAIFFSNGDMVYATSRHSSRRLGHFLVSLGFLSESELGRPGRSSHLDSVFLGQELVEDRVIEPDELRSAVRKQVLDILDEVLLWEEGAFHFDERLDPAAHPIPPGPVLGTQTILLEAIRRYDESQMVRTSFPDLSVVLLPTGDRGPEGLAPEAAQVLPLIDGKRAVDQVFRDSPLSPYETSVILTALCREGRVEPAPQPRAFPDRPSIREPLALPVAPDVPGRLSWIYRHSTAEHLDRIAAEVAGDPLLSAKVLQQFAATRLSLPREKQSVREILQALGDFRVRALLIPEVTRGIFFAERDFYWKECREQAVFHARFSKDLAERVGYPFPDEAYLAGLLSDLGIFILIGAFRERYREVLERARESRGGLGELEEAAFGVSHTMIGGLYAERWGFPKAIAETIKNHHRRDREGAGPLEDLVALAHWASRGREPGLDGRADEACIEDALKRFKLRKRNLIALSEGVTCGAENR